MASGTKSLALRIKSLVLGPKSLLTSLTFSQHSKQKHKESQLTMTVDEFTTIFTQIYNKQLNINVQQTS